jgi:hypothetical protein
MLVLAVLLGVYADVGQRVDGVLGTVPALGTPWLLLAFAGGFAWAPRAMVASLAGPVLVVLGLCSYWIFMEAAHGTPIHPASALLERPRCCRPSADGTGGLTRRRGGGQADCPHAGSGSTGS